MQKRHIAASSLTIVSLLLSNVAGIATAATTTQPNPSGTGQALEIAPPLINLNVNPGETTTTSIFLRDISKTNLLVSGQANDFLAAGNDGTPKIILDNGEKSPYSLKDWIQPLPSLNLVPREIKSMTVTLSVPKDASPGGHYGVIRFTATPPDLQNTGVSLSASIGALMLVTVSGDIHESMSLTNFKATQDGKQHSLFENAPITFITDLKNTGNVHEEPTGQIVVTNTFGKKIAGVNVNLPPRNVLPASDREFQSALDKTVIGNKLLIGHYTAKLTLTYSATKKTLTKEISFWVIPYRVIIGTVVSLVALFFILRFAIRRYNRYIIDRVQKHRRA